MHKIEFKNTPSDWNEALPLGNGVFGGMVFFNENTFTCALNHYEVYYSRHSKYSNTWNEKLKNGEKMYTPDYPLDEYLQTAEKNKLDYTKEPYLHYRKTIWPKLDEPCATEALEGTFHPATGRISLVLNDCLINAQNHCLSLEIESAKATLSASAKDMWVELNTRIFTDCDAACMDVKQTNCGAIKAVQLVCPENLALGSKANFVALNENTFYYEASFYPDGEDRERFEPFRFVGVLKLCGAKGKASSIENGLLIELFDDEKDFTIITYVQTQLQSEKLLETALLKVQSIANDLNTHNQGHKAYWDSFFAKSKITLPNKVLEKLWYYNLYIMACSSGKGGKRFEQACGLNGLWDIQYKSLWGSLWYWDVNIQSSFWGVYTSNHMELASAFNDGFLSYNSLAEKRAKEFYNAEGYAVDFPHDFYNCMGPWCAQHLWWYYEYTLDVDFLRHKAYPLFKNQILFIKHIAKWDDEKKEYYFYPDVSPEQGPVAKSSVITVSTVRYLLTFAIKANDILNESANDKELFVDLLEKLPCYKTGKIDKYGEVFCDSELTPAGYKLRHPSILMPIFPIGEISMHSNKDMRSIAENTTFYASENTELGVFPFGWIACAEARMGNGNAALKILYEQGLDCILRANGMGAEETDRWTNHCTINYGYVYYPFMMECVGEIPACINEMLLQSYDGIINVFAAIPNGSSLKERKAFLQEPQTPLPEVAREDWQECEFEGLLAKGGFEVSASRHMGKTVHIQIKSLYGGKTKVRAERSQNVFCNGKAVESKFENGIITFDTIAGETYDIGTKTTRLTTKEADIFHYTSHFGRQVFIGMDQNSNTIKLIDSFVFDYYVSNHKYHTRSPYKLSFGLARNEITKQLNQGEYDTPHYADLGFLKIEPTAVFNRQQGYGFAEKCDAQGVDSGEMNELLRDYIAGENEADFAVELPQGIYEALIVCGGKLTNTVITCNEAKVRINADESKYTADILPIIHKKGGEVHFKIKGENGLPWCLNLLVIKKLHAFV